MEANKTSKSQLKANKKWRENNPERVKYLRYKSNARTFARHHATKEDMEELFEIFKSENENYSKE